MSEAPAVLGVATKTTLGRTMQVIKTLRKRIEELSTPIEVAVTASSWRLPGVRDENELWGLLMAGKSVIGDLPHWRQGPYATRWAQLPAQGAYFDDIFDFDPGFFGLSEQQAVGMDPRHRMLLLVCWEAMVRAGRPPRTVAAARTGIFLAGVEDDYRGWNPGPVTMDWASGNGSSVAVGRLAYELGLDGPAVCIDAACASSLAAIHAARSALQRHEVDTALVAGVNLVLSPQGHEEHRLSAVLSESGTNRSYSRGCDGFVRGEACVALVLQRLSEANQVLAVIKGSAINQAGRSTGPGAPNVLSQEHLLRQVLADAHVSAGEVAFIEGHGTATQIGDAVEVEAFARAIGRVVQTQIIPISSVKSNFGHAEAAAGLVGMLKTILVLKYAQVPPLAGFLGPNEMIDLRGTGLQIVSEPVPLAGSGSLGLVTSFAVIGTSCALLLGPPPGSVQRLADSTDLDTTPEVPAWQLAHYEPTTGAGHHLGAD